MWRTPASSVRWNVVFHPSTDCRSLIIALHFGDPTKSAGLSVCGSLHSRSVFVVTFRSQERRDVSRTSAGVKPIRLALAIVLGWLKVSTTCMSFVQALLPTSTDRTSLVFSLICRDRPLPEIARQTFRQRSSSPPARSTCLQGVPVQIAPAHMQPSCRHSTGSHRHS